MVRYLILTAIIGLLTVPVWAAETEIHSRGGVYQGKWKYSEISRSQALLQIDIEDSKIQKIYAGWIANGSIYREHFSLSDGYIQYRKAGSGYFHESDFTPENVGRATFNEKGIIEYINARKLGRQLIEVQGVSRRGFGKCAALVYAGIDSPILEGDLFNEWYLITVFCDRSLSKQELSAVAADRMSGVKKDGRRLVNLAKYNFPKPPIYSSSSARAGQPGSHAVEQPGSNRKTTARRSDSSTPSEFPVAYRWQGVTELAEGTLTTSTKGSEGSLSANLGGDFGSCNGTWERKGGKAKTVKDSYGLWIMHCDNGLAASGTYKMTGQRDGEGEGRDVKGRIIKFKLGAAASEALSKPSKAPIPPPEKQDSVETRLKQVQQLLEKGLISKEEAAQKRSEILKNL